MATPRALSIRVAHEHPELRPTILPLITKRAVNLPPSVERYVQEGKDQGMDEGKAWAVAWSRYCQYKNPGSDHCKQDEYFQGRSAAVQIPSEESGGKPSYDEDFKAGFAAGKAAYKDNDKVSKSDAEKAYKRVSKKHGNWWVDGYTAAIDLARGAHATKPAQIAKKLRLARSYSGDPYWMTAKYPGVADDGTQVRKGEKVLYWPRTKTMMVGRRAEDAWRKFESEAADEDFMGRMAGEDEASLRAAVIRLAHERPEFRSKLLPLVTAS